MRPGGLTIRAGGAPSAGQLAALAAAVTAVIEGEGRAPADPRPAAYRSRWRRAALLDAVEVSGHMKADSPPWGVQ